MLKYERDPGIMSERNSCSKTDPDATFMRMKENATVEVSGSDGLRTYKEQLTGERMEIKMPSEKGVYLVRVYSGDFEKTVKVVVQ